MASKQSRSMEVRARPSQFVNVHPVDHSAGSLSSKSFDVICLGSGWGARLAATRIVNAGLSALIIEDELVGGDCPFWACVPSKVLLRPQEALYTATSVSGAKEAVVNGKSVDAAATFSRRDMFTSLGNDGELLIPMVESAGVQIARGVGTLAGVNKVKIRPLAGPSVYVDARLAVIIATGSEPIYPDIPGLREADIWEPRDATSSHVVPKHLIVMGAGAVGTEMATAYVSFGAAVTLISSSAEILPTVDREAGRIVRESLESRGVTVKVDARVTKVKRMDDGQILVDLSTGEQVIGSELLLAVGRKAKYGELNLETVGASIYNGWLPVDAHLTVMLESGNWLYAVGDATGHALLTHMSKYHGRIVSNAIIARHQGAELGGSARPSVSTIAHSVAIPQVIFSNPPVACVGLTKVSSAALGRKVRQISAPFRSIGSRIASDNAIEGWAQWLVDENNTLVGATFVGEGAADQLHASTVAIIGGLTLEQLVHAIPCFPTLSEVYLNLIDAAGY